MCEIDYGHCRFLPVTRRASILTVTLNRPDRLNAIDHDLHEELDRVFIDINRDDQTGLRLSLGLGGHSVRAGDIKAMHEHSITTNGA